MDKETQLPTYLLLIKNQLLLTSYSICRGLQYLDPSLPSDLDIRLVCLEREHAPFLAEGGSDGDAAPASTVSILRSRDCRLVYPEDGEKAGGTGPFQCAACRSLSPQIATKPGIIREESDLLVGGRKTSSRSTRRRRRQRPSTKGTRREVVNKGCDTELVSLSGSAVVWTGEAAACAEEEEVKCEPSTIAGGDDSDNDAWIADDCDVVIGTGDEAEQNDGKVIVSRGGRGRRKARQCRKPVSGESGGEEPATVEEGN